MLFGDAFLFDRITGSTGWKEESCKSKRPDFSGESGETQSPGGPEKQLIILNFGLFRQPVKGRNVRLEVREDVDLFFSLKNIERAEAMNRMPGK
jgi:hypothetical protein